MSMMSAFVLVAAAPTAGLAAAVGMLSSLVWSCSSVSVSVASMPCFFSRATIVFLFIMSVCVAFFGCPPLCAAEIEIGAAAWMQLRIAAGTLQRSRKACASGRYVAASMTSSSSPSSASPKATASEPLIQVTASIAERISALLLPVSAA